MVAAHGEVEAVGVRPYATFDFADTAPAKIGWGIVLLVAGDLAGTAANAFGHVEVETVLFAGFERAIGDECGFDFYLWRRRKELDAILRQAHDGVRGVGLCEFVERKRHIFP
jgi:hypothetical protein